MSEYLSEEEQVARLKSWWDENGTTLIVSVVVAVAAIVGWRWYDGYTLEQTYDASRAYAAYVEASEENKAAAAAHVATAHKGSAYHVFVLFHQAREALAQNDLATAESRLNEVIDVADDQLLVDLARVRLAKIQNALDRSNEALATLDAISNKGYRAWGLETKGDIHVARGEIELAYAAYGEAMASLAEGDQRPILDMKLKNVAPFEGEYVEFAATLEDALQRAQQTLDDAALQAVEGAVEQVESAVDAEAEGKAAVESNNE